MDIVAATCGRVLSFEMVLVSDEGFVILLGTMGTGGVRRRQWSHSLLLCTG